MVGIWGISTVLLALPIDLSFWALIRWGVNLRMIYLVLLQYSCHTSKFLMRIMTAPSSGMSLCGGSPEQLMLLRNSGSNCCWSSSLQHTSLLLYTYSGASPGIFLSSCSFVQARFHWLMTRKLDSRCITCYWSSDESSRKHSPLTVWQYPIPCFDDNLFLMMVKIQIEYQIQIFPSAIPSQTF